MACFVCNASRARLSLFAPQDCDYMADILVCCLEGLWITLVCFVDFGWFAFGLMSVWLTLCFIKCVAPLVFTYKILLDNSKL